MLEVVPTLSRALRHVLLSRLAWKSRNPVPIDTHYPTLTFDPTLSEVSWLFSDHVDQVHV
jgi:hypothetical protein